MRALLAIGCSLAVLASACAGVAGADIFEPISLVSTNGAEQAVYAHDPAISGAGRYVAFDGYFCGETGVWRRDLMTGAIEPVAVGEAETPAGDAVLPSISEDGRYISFTTSARLDPELDPNASPDVYVRDMDLPAGQPCEAGAEAQPGAFTLASAVDGEAEALSYQTSDPESVGSLASGRSALSADGREVAFVTTAVSNLAGAGTPALEVAVRDLDTDRTQLVSTEYDRSSGQDIPGKPVTGAEGGRTYGAVYTTTGESPLFPFTSRAYNLTPPVGASISADGSTVAWIGVNIGQQAATLPDETLKAQYSEPLWRRIADGEATPTRRITGGSDPQAPGCVASGQRQLPALASASNPCQGPFESETGIVGGVETDVLPQLSANGASVAFLATAKLLSRGSNFGFNTGPTDVYVADMTEGLTRVQALRELTAFAGQQREDLNEDAPIVDLGISPDGTQVAFSTQRTTFPLGSPAFITPPAAVAGMAELFDVDLSDDTLTRVTGGFDGGVSEHPHSGSISSEDPYVVPTDGVLSPSFSDDGDSLAFSSTASNLVYGDGNTPPNVESITFDGSDAFAIRRRPPIARPTPEMISPPPANPALVVPWTLGVTARSSKSGEVILYVAVPGPGALRASASAPVRVAVQARAARGSRKSAHRSVTKLLTRTLASASHVAHAASSVTETLELGKRYRSLALKTGGESATVTVTFASHGHRTLRDTLAVTFVRKPAKHGAKKSAKRAARRK